ncbi:MAG: DNA polymerase I [Oscillospiraceae bacterium]|nr:DNA polymerase I [Oscillospiraceae bacterium]
MNTLGLGGLARVEFDTAVGQYLLDPSRKEYLLSVMMQEHLREDFQEESECISSGEQFDIFTDENNKWSDFGLSYCLATEALAEAIRIKLEKEDLLKLYNIAELPLITVLSGMETAGFRVDGSELKTVGAGLSERITQLRERIHDIAGEPFNINSPSQLGIILFEKLGLPASKKTKTGYATGAEVLEKLVDKHEIIRLIQEHRMLVKLYGTYVEGLLPLIGEDGRIHAHFNQTVTTTGRISCTEPNLQNIPIKEETGREIRKAFLADSEDYVLVGADYSQIELRVLAHLSQDEALIEDFRQGADIHRRTAARVFNLNEDQVTTLHRSRAKAVNFGIIYGMSSFGLSEGLGITRKEAENYINEYFKTHKAVQEFMDEQIRFCRENGYVTTILGRRRWIPDIRASMYMVRQAGERLAMNTPVQGSAADIIKLAMIKVHEALLREKLRSRMILQVHDELIIETHQEELEIVSKLLKENMEGAIELSVPLIAEINVSFSWFDLK